MRKIKISSIAIIMALLATLPNPLSKAQEINSLDYLSNPQPKYGGTLVWGTVNPPTIINPVLTSYSVSVLAMSIIFDPLIRINHKGEVIPGLAQSWDISEDGLEYTFYLRQGVYFHDGVEFTAEDVKFTYDMVADLTNESVKRTNVELIQEWKVIDKYRVKMRLKYVSSGILKRLVIEIIPKHIFSQGGFKKNPANYHPIGTGFFKFKSWDKNTNQIELVANERYFEGRPYLDKIIFKVYSQATGLWTEIMREDVDLGLYLNVEDYKFLKADNTFKTYRIPWEMFYAIIYDVHDPIFSDKEVRKAIAYGINVKKIMEFTKQEGIQSNGPFHPESIGFNNEVKLIEYDPLKAKMTLMNRGWRDKNDDGILEKAGRELELRLLVDEKKEYYKQMATLIRQQLVEIGVRVRVILYDNEQSLTEEFLKTQKPQAWLRLFQGLGNDVNEAAESWYSLSSQFGNFWRYKNDQVDQLFESGRITESYLEKRKIYQSIHKIVYEDQPASFLFFPETFHAISARYEDTDEFFCHYMPFFEIRKWHVVDRNS